jgi:hypothetical protein
MVGGVSSKQTFGLRHLQGRGHLEENIIYIKTGAERVLWIHVAQSRVQ